MLVVLLNLFFYVAFIFIVVGNFVLYKEQEEKSINKGRKR